MAGRFEEVTLYIWGPEGKACSECVGMKGVYTEPPAEPHPKCKCSVTSGTVEARTVGTETTSAVVGQHVERVDGVSLSEHSRASVADLGGSATTDTDTVTVTGQGGVTVGAAPLTGTVGGSVAGSRSRAEGTTSSRTVTHFFDYDPDEGGEMQWVVAIYDLIKHTRITHWEYDKNGDGEADGTFETRKSWLERGDLITYDVVAVDPGLNEIDSSEEEDDDDEGSVGPDLDD